MSDDDDPIELRGAVDDDAGVPTWERRRRVMRWIALIALLGMLLPTAVGTYSVARSTAEQSCRLAVDVAANERTPSRVAFELLSPEAMGWTCYAVIPSGDVLVALLGLIPGAPRLAPRTLS
ncbi:MAG: hypothetical protein K2X36_12430 [Microbacteriaceae bacterium]|nr:hypothetical protein [Microbacteriaceae bacterium]